MTKEDIKNRIQAIFEKSEYKFLRLVLTGKESGIDLMTIVDLYHSPEYLVEVIKDFIKKYRDDFEKDPDNKYWIKLNKLIAMDIDSFSLNSQEIIKQNLSDKLRPADCIDQCQANMLHEQGIQFNEDSLVVSPNYVTLTIGNCSLKIGMSRFRKFAEWYLEPQEIKS